MRIDTIKVYKKDSTEYHKLSFAASVFTYLAFELNLKIQEFGIADLCFNASLGKIWTTVYAIEDGFQMLSVEERNKIISANADNIYFICKEILLNSIDQYPNLFAAKEL